LPPLRLARGVDVAVVVVVDAVVPCETIILFLISTKKTKN